MTLGYAECYYIGVMKTLCSFLDRLDKRKHIQKERDVNYGSGKYHYTEKKISPDWRNSFTVFSQSDKSPIRLMKEMIERVNTNLI